MLTVENMHKSLFACYNPVCASNIRAMDKLYVDFLRGEEDRLK